MGTFELVEPEAATRSLESAQAGELGSDVLLHNAHWFMNVRWLVAGVFMAAGLAGRFAPRAMDALALSVPVAWLWALGAGLIATNVAFMAGARRVTRDAIHAGVKALLWLQIAVDLVEVTLLVHVIGSTQTFISFIYLFHITLACIFFPKRESLLVTIAAAVLYVTVVALEVAGRWPSPGVFRGPGFSSAARSFRPGMYMVGSALFIWFVVWYLVSTLSEVVRKRDLQLARMNERLLRLDREKNVQMLLTTHELKSPFAGIESNIEVLKIQHWAEIPEPVRAVLERIDHRAQLLSERISKILFLGNLKSSEITQGEAVPVDLEQVFAAVLKNVEQKAQDRRITIDACVPAVTIPGNAEQFVVLFTNLVVNAILYSQEGGRVEIQAREEEDAVRLSVSDHGIGIREDALPHIFEEFYRTKEGAQFNKMSTGLGLAIVREIARRFHLRIRVSSEEGKGTTFEVVLPRAPSREQGG